jgi:hypothetical protein
MARNDYFKEREEIFGRAETILTANFSKVNDEIFEEVKAILRDLDIQAGNIAVNSARNNQILNQAFERIRVAILKTDYRSNVTGYLRNFEQISQNNILFHSTVNQLANVDVSITNLQRVAIQNTVKNLLGTNMDARFTDLISSNLQSYITSGANIQEVETSLRTFIKGDTQKLGHLERYVKQISGDAIRQYDGQIQGAIQAEYKLNAVSYEGSLIKDSRPQCVRWVKKFGGIIKISELEKEINWAFKNGSGMIDGTVPGNFYQNRGGYSCRHQATAINIAE